jgi:low temperature requirement protein LtrA
VPHWWQKPRLRRDAELGLHRKASWLELFYDLVFVVIVAQLAHTLVGRVGWDSVGAYVLMFVPAWWLWIAGTFYAERFEHDDISHRIMVFVSMFPVAALALFTHHGTGGTSREFALAYAAGRLLVVFSWWRGGRHDRDARRMTQVYVRGFSAAIAVMVASVFLPLPWRLGAWGVALLIDLATPFFSAGAQRELPKLSLSHLGERFGLFTIIVLGESMVGVVQGLASSPQLSGWGVAEAALGMTIAFSMWWIYFDAVEPRAPRRGLGFARSYLHLPLVMAFAATGAAITNVVSHPGAVLPEGTRALMCGAIATSSAALATLSFVVRAAPAVAGTARLLRGILAAVSLAGAALAVWGGALGPTTMLGILAAGLLAAVVVASVMRHRDPAHAVH